MVVYGHPRGGRVDLSLVRRDTRRRVCNPGAVLGSDSVVPRHTSLHGSLGVCLHTTASVEGLGDRGAPPLLSGRGAQVVAGPANQSRAAICARTPLQTVWLTCELS